MAKIGSILADLGLNTANFEAGIKTAQGALKRFGHTAQRQFKRMNAAAGQFATRMGAAAAVGFGFLIKGALDTADAMEKMERRLGISTEALSQLKFAGEQSGIAFNTLTMAMQRSSRRIAEAAEGMGEAKGALRELKLDAHALNQMAPDRQLLAIAEAMQKVGTSGDKTRLAMKLFDSEGVSLLQMFENGAIGIEELMQRADELGLTLNNKTAKGAAAANDAINEAKSAMQGAALQAATRLIPAIEDLGKGFSDFLPKSINYAIGSFYKLRINGLTIFGDMVTRVGKMQATLAGFFQNPSFVKDHEALTKRLALSDAILQKRIGKGQTTKGEDKRNASLRESLRILEETNKTASDLLKASKFSEEWAKNLGLTKDEAEAVVLAIEKGYQVQEMAANPKKDPKAMWSEMAAGIELAKQKAEKFGETLNVDVFDKTTSMMDQMKNQFKSVIQDMINTLISSGIRQMLGSMFSMGSPGGLLAKAGSLFGFANGGSFEVGGKGGTDSNLVAFKATRGETVTVNKAGESGGGGGGIVFQNSYDFRGSTLTESEVRQMISQSNQVTKRQIQNEMMRGRF